MGPGSAADSAPPVAKVWAIPSRPVSSTAAANVNARNVFILWSSCSVISKRIQDTPLHEIAFFSCSKENSPALQRWDLRMPKHKVPVGHDRSLVCTSNLHLSSL